MRSFKDSLKCTLKGLIQISQFLWVLSVGMVVLFFAMTTLFVSALLMYHLPEKSHTILIWMRLFSSVMVISVMGLILKLVIKR